MRSIFIFIILLLIEYCKTVQGDGVQRQQRITASTLGQTSDFDTSKEEIQKTRKVKRAQRNKIKIIKKINFLERSKERKSGEMSKKSNRKCDNFGNCTCNFDFMVDLAKLNNKYVKKLKDLKNILKWWKLLQGKHGKAVLDSSLIPPAPAFSVAFNLLSAATAGGTTCNGGNISNNALNIYNELMNCTASATFACDYTTITNNFRKLLCKDCYSECSVTSPNCTKKAVCETTCSDDPSPGYGTVTLTQPMMDHVENICIPQLTAWTRRYTSCGACVTFTDCVYSCQNGTRQYNCQAKKCETCLETGLPRNVVKNCSFENCLKAGDNMKGCMCDCYTELEDTKKGNFPIDTTLVDGKNCMQLAQFLFSVRMRKRRCLNPDGITREEEVMGNEKETRGDGYRPTSSPNDERIAGNFVDCRRQERNAMEYIYACKFNGTSTPSTATSTSGRRNQFLEAVRTMQLMKRNA